MHLILTKKQEQYVKWKRIVEFILASIGIPLILPILILAGIWIIIDDPGNVIYLQKRPGLHGKCFTIIKLRTMYRQLSDRSFELAHTNDKRITRAGKWLRKYHVDELPQLFNVWWGQLSLIGPRPVPFELQKSYQDKISDYDYRHSVKPGISGLAQIIQGYTKTPEEESVKCKIDLWYVSNLSPMLDLEILWCTFFGNSILKAKLSKRIIDTIPLDQVA